MNCGTSEKETTKKWLPLIGSCRMQLKRPWSTRHL